MMQSHFKTFVRRACIVAVAIAVCCWCGCKKLGKPVGPDDDGDVIIGLYADDGAAEACVTAAENMFQWMGYTVERLDAEAVNYEDLDHIDVFYFPGGSSGPYCRDITGRGRIKICNLVSAVWQGNAYTDSQLGVFLGTAEGPIPEIYADPEIGMCQVNLNASHPIAQSIQVPSWIMYYNGPYFYADEDVEFDTVGTYDITGRPALVACLYEQGRVFLTGPHPEWEEDSDRDGVSYFDGYDDQGSDWELMRNATRWCLHELE
jgi:glutamine amidotransferase-like uncharacterized protein